jgi:hypothetical protein
MQSLGYYTVPSCFEGIKGNQKTLHSGELASSEDRGQAPPKYEMYIAHSSAVVKALCYKPDVCRVRDR